MHELSVMSQVVESVTRELKGKAVTRVESVRLEVGELTMLGKDQLKFAWGILTEDAPLKGARLIVVKKPAVIECQKCNFRGGAKHPTGLGSHLMTPYICCPKCGGDVRIVGGRECIIRSLRAVMKGEGADAGRRVPGAGTMKGRRSRPCPGGRHPTHINHRRPGTRHPAPGSRSLKGGVNSAPR